MTRTNLPTGRRRGLFGTIFAVTMLVALILVPNAQAILAGSPSNFESNDGNMVHVGTNHDWENVAFDHVSDLAASTSDDSFTPGQKQDTTCPTVEGHKNPGKDDFSDVASFTEVNSTTGATYLYGATIRTTANGTASENVELKQSKVLCPGSTTLTARSAGDKLIAIDYLNGGSSVQFNVLTWVVSGACFVGNHTAPCWGANVLTLTAAGAEGSASTAPITAANNPINGRALAIGQFAEFGINLAIANIIPTGSCKTFNQTVWESRASGSSFVSSTKDIAIEDKAINNCASVSVTKAGSDDGAQTGAVFTLYAGTIASGNGTVVGTCTVIADGTCPVTTGSFTDLTPGTYHIDETTVPAGYGKDPTLPLQFTLATGEAKALSFTDPALEGALVIQKNSTKGSAVLVAGAVFSYDGSSVTDNGAGDEDDTIGTVCVSGLVPGDYTVNETSPPDGYGDADATEADQTATVVNGTDCDSNLPDAGATATFTNPPLSDIQVNFRDGGSGETSAVIDCDNTTGTSDTTAASGWETSETNTGIEGATTVTCTIVIDP
jgi:hypothetical protein